MFISVQFKNKEKIFGGKHYDFELIQGDEVPAIGSIIRMMDEDYNFVCYGTRVKVTGIKMESMTSTKRIHYMETSLDD